MTLKVSEEQRLQVEQLLGRPPRGLKDVPVLNPQGQPMVIRVASLVDDKPFPTLFWLVDPDICYRIDGEEARGLIARLQDQINHSPELKAGMARDHERYIALRESYIDDQERQRISELGFSDVFKQKGIGGIADFSRIRCLHTWYGAHLVHSNTVGQLLDEHWSQLATD
ncbi:MAG: DUF501 domain-containing protein [Halioglobus sp.]